MLGGRHWREWQHGVEQATTLIQHLDSRRTNTQKIRSCWLFEYCLCGAGRAMFNRAHQCGNDDRYGDVRGNSEGGRESVSWREAGRADCVCGNPTLSAIIPLRLMSCDGGHYDYDHS